MDRTLEQAGISAFNEVSVVSQFESGTIDITQATGIGGLHSQEKSISVVSNETHVMRNADFASYYPFIILNQGLYPKHLGTKFLSVYRSIVETRLRAKADGNKLIAESLKITINGSFGKLGSKYSKLYSPNLMLATTITGQLTLLMLIEQLGITCGHI